MATLHADLPPIIIAVDGFSSSGKSTMARALASKIGYRYIDSGAMYRALTLFALRRDMIAPDGEVDTRRLIPLLPDIKIDFKVMPDGSQHTLLDGEDVEGEIRDMKVSSKVSFIAAVPEVRHALVALQQRLGKDKGIVMDGRDIGTTVFPEAELKIFVDASAQTRARRRYLELRAKGSDASFDDILANVEARDHVDLTRRESPLRRAHDAVALDNSDMTIDEQSDWLMKEYEKAVSRVCNKDN